MSLWLRRAVSTSCVSWSWGRVRPFMTMARSLQMPAGSFAVRMLSCMDTHDLRPAELANLVPAEVGNELRMAVWYPLQVKPLSSTEVIVLMARSDVHGQGQCRAHPRRAVPYSFALSLKALDHHRFLRIPNSLFWTSSADPHASSMGDGRH